MLERKFLCFYCNQPGHRKVDCDLFKRHKAEKEATRGSGESKSAPAVNAVLNIECDDTSKQPDIKESDPKDGEILAGVAAEGKVGGSASGEVLVVTRSQEKAREGAAQQEKGRPTTLDW